VVACAACGARHHDACRAEHGRCATCGALDLLVPRPSKRRVLDPPAGSKLVVRHEGERVVIELPGSGFEPGQAPVLMVFFVWAFLSFSLITRGGADGPPIAGGGFFLLLAAVAFVAKRRYRGPAAPELVLDPDAIAFPGVDRFFGFSIPVRATRAEAGSVRTGSRKDGYALQVDVGLERWRVRLGSTAFSEPEVDWIAAAIRAWKDEA
jgi:hypothetical protein